jgi:outer membrane protein assembly factor BamA
LFLQRSREEIGASTTNPSVTDKTSFTAEQRFRPWRKLQMSYSLNAEHNHTFEKNPSGNPNLPALDLTVNIARLTTTALLDTRNDLYDATSGLFTSSTFEYGHVFDVDLRFTKYFVQQNYYRTLGHSVVFATSGRLGLAASQGQDLLQTDKYLAGGGNSVRGYKQDGLGPLDFRGDPLGGNALLVFNEELRFPIFWRFRGVGFFDAGNVFPTIGDLGLGSLRAGTGVGLRVVTPFALLRADVAAPVHPQPGEGRIKWFFSIGQSF